jgi:hypothetical protein
MKVLRQGVLLCSKPRQRHPAFRNFVWPAISGSIRRERRDPCTNLRREDIARASHSRPDEGLGAGDPDQLLLLEKPVPVPSRAEVLIRIDAVAICATDLEIIHSGSPRQH